MLKNAFLVKALVTLKIAYPPGGRVRLATVVIASSEISTEMF